jgi:hypothetical protein
VNGFVSTRRASIAAGLLVLAALLVLRPGDSVAPATAAETLEANTAGVAFLGRAGPHGIYEVGLAIPNDHAAVLEVSGGRTHELPFEQWARYAVRPMRPLSSGVLRAEFGAIGRYSYGAGPLFLRVSEPGSGSLSATVQGVSYNADPTAPGTWSGELEARFLGGGSRLLNGPDSKTRLCRYSSSGQSTECVGDPPPLISGGPFDP